MGKTIFAIRFFNSRVSPSDENLALHGMAIGNNLDNYKRSRTEFDTFGSAVPLIEFKIPAGKWPVYLAKDLESALRRAQPGDSGLNPDFPGAVCYIAEIDPSILELGLNLPYYQPSRLFHFTLLSPMLHNNGTLVLKSKWAIDELNNELRQHFNNEGVLVSSLNGKYTGEFYLDNYICPEQFISERIFRVLPSGEIAEVTAEIQEIRRGGELSNRLKLR